MRTVALLYAIFLSLKFRYQDRIPAIIFNANITHEMMRGFPAKSPSRAMHRRIHESPVLPGKQNESGDRRPNKDPKPHARPLFSVNGLPRAAPMASNSILRTAGAG
jgi:hypothetical protein